MICSDKKCKGYGKDLVNSNFGMVCSASIGKTTPYFKKIIEVKK